MEANWSKLDDPPGWRTRYRFEVRFSVPYRYSYDEDDELQPSSITEAIANTVIGQLNWVLDQLNRVLRIFGTKQVWHPGSDRVFYAPYWE